MSSKPTLKTEHAIIPKEVMKLGMETSWVWLSLYSRADSDGFICFSVRSLADEINMSYQRLRSCLAKLLDTPFLVQEKGTLTTSLRLIVSPEKAAPKAKTTLPADAIDFDGFMTFFNEKVKGTDISSIRSMSQSRRSLIKARCREYGKQEVMNVIHRVVASDFLSGRSGRGFRASFNWIFNATNFLKIIEGTYDNTKAANGAGLNNRQSEFVEFIHKKFCTPDAPDAEISGNY